MKKFIFFMVLTLGVAMSAGEVIKLKFGKIQTLVDMEESEASKEFIAMLPLSLKFSDYANKEKIANLPTPLTAKGSQYYTPQIGDLFYFSPWGNIGIFYDKQLPNSALVPLGKLRDKIKELSIIENDFEITFTKD